MGKWLGVKGVWIHFQPGILWDGFNQWIGLRKILQDPGMWLQRAIGTDEAKKALVPLVLAGRAVPQIIGVIGKAPDDRAGRAAVVQLGQRRGG